MRHRPERKRGRSTATTPTLRESSGDKLWRCQCVCGLLSIASVRRVGGARVEGSTVKGEKGRISISPREREVVWLDLVV